MALPIVSVAQMRHWEQASWDAGRSQAEVISCAGQAVARCALELTQSGDSILIVAGKGHNGDDARCARNYLGDRQVEILTIRNPGEDLAGLGEALKRKPHLVIDGIFGIGLSRPLDADWSQLIERLNQANARVLAVDVPSGLNADTGEPQNVAVCATVTVTLGAPKKGLLAASAYPFVGKLEVASEIGLVPCPFSGEALSWSQEDDFAEYPPRRRVDGHKGTYGHLAIFAGSHGYHGAAVLASRGALRARPGLVSVFVDPPVYVPVASQSQAAMVHSFTAPLHLPPSCSAVAIGPGLASPENEKAWKSFTQEQWQTAPHPVLVDASALEWIEKGSTPLNSRRVITPHPGEVSRMLETKTELVQADRLDALRELSSRYGNCWVVLKGHQTLIGRSSGEVFVNPTGNPYMAQGGSGDVLSGFMGGLLAQTRLQAQPLKVIRYAVWKHGEAADRLTASGFTWTIEELLQTIGD